MLGLWAIGASWLAVSARLALSRLQEEQVEVRLTYDSRIKGLTRRLVGVASHQVLEQEGLGDRLADIISRQVELENRQSALLVLADRLSGAAPSAAGQHPALAAPAAPLAQSRGRPDVEPPDIRGRPAPPAEPPTLKLGVPSAQPPGSGSAPLGPRSSLDGPAPRPDKTGGAASLLQTSEAVPLREQFAVLENSLSSVQNLQTRLVSALTAGIRNAIATIRTTIEGLGLTLPTELLQAREVPRNPGGSRKGPEDFEAQLSAVEGEFQRLQRWRTMMESVPLRRPVEGENNFTSNFGVRKDPFTGEGRMHAGIDFRGPLGSPIRAAASGRVITAEVTGGYGNLVEIEHSSGIITRYAHLSAFNVNAGQTVAAGTTVGLLGSTGRSTGPHLHYETRVNGGAVDPMRFLMAGARLYDHPPPLAITEEGTPDALSYD